MGPIYYVDVAEGYDAFVGGKNATMMQFGTAEELGLFGSVTNRLKSQKKQTINGENYHDVELRRLQIELCSGKRVDVCRRDVCDRFGDCYRRNGSSPDMKNIRLATAERRNLEKWIRHGREGHVDYFLISIKPSSERGLVAA